MLMDTLSRYHIIYLLGFALRHRLLDCSNVKVRRLISEGNKGMRLIRTMLRKKKKQPQVLSDTKSPLFSNQPCYFLLPQQ